MQSIRKSSMIKICEICGKEFETKSKNAKYCSDDCRRAAKNAQRRKSRLENKLAKNPNESLKKQLEEDIKNIDKSSKKKRLHGAEDACNNKTIVYDYNITGEEIETSENCKQCRFRKNFGFMNVKHICDYMLTRLDEEHEVHRRPCGVGDNCTVMEPIRRRKNENFIQEDYSLI